MAHGQRSRIDENNVRWYNSTHSIITLPGLVYATNNAKTFSTMLAGSEYDKCVFSLQTPHTSSTGVTEGGGFNKIISQQPLLAPAFRVSSASGHVPVPVELPSVARVDFDELVLQHSSVQGFVCRDGLLGH